MSEMEIFCQYMDEYAVYSENAFAENLNNVSENVVAFNEI